jgi:hypothetical protein
MEEGAIISKSGNTHGVKKKKAIMTDTKLVLLNRDT